MSLTNKWFPNINIYLCHMCVISVGCLGIESVVRRIEKRTNVKKVILLPEWSSGGVNLKSFYLHCWNGPWRRCMCVLSKFFYLRCCDSPREKVFCCLNWSYLTSCEKLVSVASRNLLSSGNINLYFDGSLC